MESSEYNLTVFINGVLELRPNPAICDDVMEIDDPPVGDVVSEEDLAANAERRYLLQHLILGLPLKFLQV